VATILVVDDVEMFRNVVAHALNGAGHHPLCAPDGAAALAVLESTAVDVVLLDLAMPRMNGMEFLERLRADPRHKTLPVVVVSALSQSPHALAISALGAHRQLLKSRFSLRDLIQCVNDLLAAAA
jgi:CheY-like chemotaxis protein